MREHDIRTVLSEGGTDVDEAIRRAAEELVRRHICTSYGCNCAEYAQSVIREHISPVIAAKAEIEKLRAERDGARKAWQLAEKHVTTLDLQVTEWKRKAEAAEAKGQDFDRVMEPICHCGARLSDGHEGHSFTAMDTWESMSRHIADLQAHLAAAREDTARLNWLEQEGFVSRRVHSWRKDGATSDQPLNWSVSGVRIATLREAIDAAREKGGA